MRIHLVQMRLGQICVGMIHKFIPPKKKEDQNFLKQLNYRKHYKQEKK